MKSKDVSLQMGAFLIGAVNDSDKETDRMYV